jgi:hypothetical protein
MIYELFGSKSELYVATLESALVLTYPQEIQPAR